MSSCVVATEGSDNRVFNLKSGNENCLQMLTFRFITDNLIKSVKKLNSDIRFRSSESRWSSFIRPFLHKFLPKLILRQIYSDDDDVTFWTSESWLSAKEYLHNYLPKPMLRKIYSELFHCSFATLSLSEHQTMLLWWLFLEPSAMDSPPSDLPMPDWGIVRGRSSTKLNLLLLRLLAQDKTSRKLESLSLAFYDYEGDNMVEVPAEVLAGLTPALVAVARKQPHLFKLKLSGFVSEPILGTMFAELSTVPHLQELDLDFYCSSHQLSNWPSCLASHSSTLTTLEIACSEEDDVIDRIMQEANTYCPNLIKLSLLGEIPPYHPNQFMPSVKELRLDLVETNVDFDLSSILRIFPNVTDLKLASDGDIMIDSHSLPHLQALSHCITLLDCKVHHSVRWWQVVQCCPNARRLTIIVNYEEDMEEELISPGHFTLPFLKDLWIGKYEDDFDFFIRSEDIIPVLKSSLALEQLCLYKVSVTPPWTPLIKLLKEKRVLNKLQELFIHSDNHTSTSTSLLVELMNLPKLNTVYGAPMFKLDKAGMEQVLALAKEKDMEIKVREPGDNDSDIKCGWNVTKRNEGRHSNDDSDCIIA